MSCSFLMICVSNFHRCVDSSWIFSISLFFVLFSCACVMDVAVVNMRIIHTISNPAKIRNLLFFERYSETLARFLFSMFNRIENKSV